MLFLLLSVQRCQTPHLICLEDITFSEDTVIINTSHILKTSKPGQHQTPFRFDSYKLNKNLCIVSMLREYLRRTNALRGTNKLMISTIKPHRAASKQTLCRWIKMILLKAGINESFKPHSTRPASSSMAKMCGIPLQIIMKSAWWANAKTFAKYYNKPISNNCNSSLQDIIKVFNSGQFSSPS